MSFVYQAEVRTESGKGASRRLRHADMVPAIVYGANQEAISIALDHKKLIIDQAKPEFYSSVITLVINGAEVNVKAQAMQRHPVKPKVVHMDFVRV